MFCRGDGLAHRLWCETRQLARRPLMIVYLCDGIKDVPWDYGEIFGGNSSICHDCHGIYCV